MRIQHNIMAMNAYRNYNNNTSALAKNLEKLSSGYKINRAGDDAAGLAISEKMRAQITGLKQAQANAKSGINLIQTAEGATTEIHDMLRRMLKLADQSANGTYDDEVDRVQLQKEVTQLKSEIDRIADASNFNGIKLLDGSMEASGTKYEISGKANLAILTGETTTVGQAGTNTIIHTDGRDAAKTKFTVELNNVSFVTNATSQNAGITVGGVSITAALTKDEKLGGEDLAKALADAKSSGVSIGGVTYNVTADGTKLVFEMSDDSIRFDESGSSGCLCAKNGESGRTVPMKFHNFFIVCSNLQRRLTINDGPCFFKLYAVSQGGFICVGS